MKTREAIFLSVMIIFLFIMGYSIGYQNGEANKNRPIIKIYPEIGLRIELDRTKF